MKHMIWLDPMHTGKYIRKMVRFLVTGMISALIIHFFAVQSSAADVTLQWDTNDDADYYIVYYGTSSGDLSNESDTISAPTTQATLDVTEGTTWYFSVKAFNSCGNSSDFSDVISYTTTTTTEPDPLVATIESPALNASIYQGDSINFLGSITGGTVSYSYAWDFGDSGVSVQTVEDPGDLVFLNTGTFQITFTVTDGSGSTSSDSVQVTVQEQDIQPVATITSPDGGVEITAGSSVTFAGSYSGGNGTCTHAWDFGDSGAAARTVEDPGAVVFSEVGSYTVTYTVTDSDGDSASDTVDVFVEPVYVNLIPTATITSPDGAAYITAGSSVTFAGSCSGGDGTCTHAWDFGNSGVSAQTVEDPGSVVFSEAGSYTVTYTVTDSDGDTDSATVDVVVEAAYVNRIPTATITSPDGAVYITTGSGVTFAGSYIDGNGPSAHTWNFGDYGPATQSVEDPGAVVFSAAGLYTVTYTVTDTDGDTASDSVNITVYDAPSATITSPASAVKITEGDSVTFEGSFSGGIGSITHSWVFGDNGPANQSVEDPGAVTFPQAGTYTVVYTVTDGNREYDSDLVVVTVDAIVVDTGGDSDTTDTTDTTDDSTTTDGTDTADDFSTTTDTSIVPLEPILVADVDEPVTEIQWQISRDPDFKDVVLNARIRNSNTLTVPEMILNSGEEYYWRYRNKTPKAADKQWTDAQTFVTEAAVWNDNNGNGVPDAQEAPDGLDLNMDGVADETQPDTIRCVKSTLGDSVIGLMKTDGVVDIELLESIDYTTITDRANMPESMPSGMIGFRVVVETIGATVHMGVYFNNPIPLDAIWYKYDSVNGWVDYTANTVISDDRMMITVILTDGGLGDADGIANGVIVDPSGIGLNFSSDSDTPLGVDATEEGCFIGGSSSGQETGWAWLIIPMAAFGLLGLIRKPKNTIAE